MEFVLNLKPAETPTASSPDSVPVEKPPKDSKQTEVKLSIIKIIVSPQMMLKKMRVVFFPQTTDSKESKRKHRKDKSDRKEKHEKERKKEKRKRKSSEKSDSADTPAVEPEKQDEPSIMEIKEEKKQVRLKGFLQCVLN